MSTCTPPPSPGVHRISKSSPLEVPSPAAYATFAPASESKATNKPRKPPTITPRTFTRFFTPKASGNSCGSVGASRRILRDITSSATNRHRRDLLGRHLRTHDAEEEGNVIERKRRRLSTANDDDSCHSSPICRRSNRRATYITRHACTTAESVDRSGLDYSSTPKSPPTRAEQEPCLRPTTLSRAYVHLGRGLQRELHGQSRPTYTSKRLTSTERDTILQYAVRDFVSGPQDRHNTMTSNVASHSSIPFCTASCNTNSLVAIGDEDGGIRLLESSKDDEPGFSQLYLQFRPHTNAILDLAFSQDDRHLATASGDQSAQIIDMPTQRAIHRLCGHASSVKQIRFQPGSSSILATSSRDGSVQVWDLRCTGIRAPVRELVVAFDPENSRTVTEHKLAWPRSVNTIFDAHASPSGRASSAKSRLPLLDTPFKTEASGRRGDVSITALNFFPQGREHLLLTGSEANATVKLWDLRLTHTGNRHRAMPLSSTRQPESHNKHRQFGLTSTALSTDGARLYTVCRDNTVYVYSTSHLMLGYAPELCDRAVSRARKTGGPEKQGLGPMYGLRHPQFHATTFYVKSSLRRADADCVELLAVGSSDGTPVLFSTDERLLTPSRSSVRQDETIWSSSISSPLTLHRTASCPGQAARLEDNIPIYDQGAALIRGHDREVTGLTWSKAGDLITASDDYSVRCWREAGPKADELRSCGESEGKRWGYGWADSSPGANDNDD